MADAVVSVLVKRLGDLLIKEAASLHGVREEVVRLQAELKRMQCFLKDADFKQEHDERVRCWIAEIRDVAYNAEDIIDTFILNVATAKHGGFIGVLERLVPSIFSKASHLLKIHRQIESVRTKIADISNSMQTYGMQFVGEGEGADSTAEMQRRLRRSYPHIEEEVVGLEDCIRNVIAQLMIEEERLCVVSIVGMGGLGKTTLAKKVYNHIEVKRRFDCYAWVFVSQQCSVKEILLVILNKVTGDGQKGFYERMREDELVEKLYMVISEKRYLIVIDDIWRNEQWDCLKPAFPSGKNGSKVLFTTRNREVAMYADPWSSLIEPPFLTEEEGWELLCRKAFLRDAVDDRNCVQEFEKLGREMVRKCGGLPLAIAVLGGLLATKRSLKEWEVVQRSISSHLNKFQQKPRQYGGVNAILALSYYELPFHLKPCFLYFGMFPEDWEIHKTKMIRLWIAEGFVPQPLGQENATMEELAEEYLQQLINRCMVQVGTMDHTGTSIKTCRIHDLMRDLCVSKAREENFLGIIQREENVVHSVEPRRIAILPGIYPSQYFPMLRGYLHLRSLLCSSIDDQLLLPMMERTQEVYIYRKFSLLRVLDLKYEVRVRTQSVIPKAIGNLVHLRYLGLKQHLWMKKQRDHSWRSIRNVNVPQSISNIRCLQTIDIRGHMLVKLPRVMSRLVNLRHLLTDGIEEVQCPMDSFKNIETLTGIHCKDLIRFDAMSKLTNLRRLGINFGTLEEIDRFLLSPIIATGCLVSLSLRIQNCWESHVPFSNLELLSCCQYLSKLRITGNIVDNHYNRQHNLEFLPANLSKLILNYSKLKQDPMPVLEKLPNMKFLELGPNSYCGSKIVCSVNGFPQLETLRLNNLGLEEWQVAEGAMPSLRHLYMESLKRLGMIPEGLKSVTTLQTLEFKFMGWEFVKRLEVVNGVEGEDYYKVRHVPSILSYPHYINKYISQGALQRL